MRVWGRQYSNDGTYVWASYETDANGYNDAVYITALCQVLQLNLGESPFWANYGIPAIDSITTQIFPDLSVYFIQQQYSQYFASLKITKVNATNDKGSPTPVYNVAIVTQQGAIINRDIPIGL